MEKAGPFETFRWSTRPGSLRSGHPRANAPHYGVVRADAVRYRAAIIPSIADDLSAENPLFRLNTDMYLLKGALCSVPYRYHVYVCDGVTYVCVYRHLYSDQRVAVLLTEVCTLVRA